MRPSSQVQDSDSLGIDGDVFSEHDLADGGDGFSQLRLGTGATCRRGHQVGGDVHEQTQVEGREEGDRVVQPRDDAAPLGGVQFLRQPCRAEMAGDGRRHRRRDRHVEQHPGAG